MLSWIRPCNLLALLLILTTTPSISFSVTCTEVIGKKKPDGSDSVTLICQRVAKVSIDLNDSDAMAKLYKSNPGVYLKANRVIEVLGRSSKEEVESEIVKIGAENVFMGRNILFMTNPPQTNVSFILGETRFEGRIFIDNEILALKRINVRDINE